MLTHSKTKTVSLMYTIYLTLSYPFYATYICLRHCFFYLRYPQLAKVSLVMWIYYQHYYSLSKLATEKKKTGKNDQELTYGETPFHTIERILNKCNFKANQRFIDLGCGKGKLCLFVSLRFPLSVIGIDIMPTYITIANKLKEKLMLKKIEFYCQDILDFELNKGDIFYISLTCFSKEMRRKIQKRFESIEKEFYIISTTYPFTSDFFKPIYEGTVNYSWGNGSIYIQKRTLC